MTAWLEGKRALVVGAGSGIGRAVVAAFGEEGANIAVLERDPYKCDALRQELPQVPVVEGDAMTLDWAALLAGADRWCLVANLPYNVATPLVADLLDEVPAIKRFLVMVQKEVAQRLAAPARHPAYGPVSVKVAYWGTARMVGDVPASVFFPRPNVESALVEIVRRPPPEVDREAMFGLVKTAFGQRRKMLRRSLVDHVTPLQFAHAEVAPTARPEELGLDEWVRLTRAVTGG